jgi:hypothetical protein
MMGINTLGTGAIGAAQEGVQSVEISLVVDTSGSMSGTKISALKTSAKSFIQAVVDEQRQTAVTSVSIIPYNTTIVVPDSLLSRLNTNDVIDIPPIDQAPYPGAAVNYMRTSYTSASSTQGSKCVRFYDSEMLVSDLEENVDLNVNPNPNYMLMRRITQTQELDMMAYYDQGDKSYGSGGAHSPPGDDYNRRCDPTRAEILPFGTTIQALEDHIDTLDASGWTAVDHGLKWGVALLDPAMRPIVNNMISNNLLPTTMQDRPHEYDPAATLKVLVLMTDGANTNQYDLRPEYKNGPSRIWYSEMAANDTGPAGENWINDFIVDSNENGTRDRAKSWYDGYFVEMPANNAGQRWLRQHKPWDNDDGVMYAESELPADAVQMTYTELYDRFSENALANFFRDTDKPTDYTAYNDHRDAEIQVENEASADRRMNGPADESEFGMCDVAKVNNDILVYTIAFQAGSHAEAVMRECASGVNGSGFFFDADNSSDLNDAFAAIAGSITKLRLTQ